MEAAQQVLSTAADVARQQAFTQVEAAIPDITTRTLNASPEKAFEEALLIASNRLECIYQEGVEYMFVVTTILFLIVIFSMYGLAFWLEDRRIFHPVDPMEHSPEWRLLREKLAWRAQRRQRGAESKDLEKGLKV